MNNELISFFFLGFCSKSSIIPEIYDNLCVMKFSVVSFFAGAVVTTLLGGVLVASAIYWP